MPLVKICGIKTLEAAQVAVEAGSDLLGMILVPNRDRTVDIEIAQAIAQLVKQKRAELGRKHQTMHSLLNELYSGTYGTIEEFQQRVLELFVANGPFLTGVFRNQSVEDVFELAQRINLDIIQLHGSEDKLEYARYNGNTGLRYAVIPRFVIPQDIELMESVFATTLSAVSAVSTQSGAKNDGLVLPLLDSEAGGEGKKIDWSQVGHLEFGKYILAGGLTPENVAEALLVNNVIGVDVSGGVEANGAKDHEKIRAFVANAAECN